MLIVFWCSLRFFTIRKNESKKTEIKCANILELLTVAFEKSTMSRTQVQFKEGRVDVNDSARPGRSSTLTNDENNEALKKMILNNHRITIREVADDAGISFGSC